MAKGTNLFTTDVYDNKKNITVNDALYVPNLRICYSSEVLFKKNTAFVAEEQY